MASDDKTNDEMDAEAEPLWDIPDERQREAALTNTYSPLVNRCVSSAISDNPNLERDDATQEAFIRLITCIRKFDRTRGARFTTYATGPLTFGTLDAARNEDWVPAKARAADRDEQSLPVMFAMDPALDTDADEDVLQSMRFDIAEIIAVFQAAGIKSVVDDLNLALECEFNFELMAERMNPPVTVHHAIYTVKTAFERAKDPQAYIDEIRSLPPYTPPEPGSCRVQQRMFGAA